MNLLRSIALQIIQELGALHFRRYAVLFKLRFIFFLLCSFCSFHQLISGDYRLIV